MASLISEHLAMALHDAGLHWKPAPGDRFVLRQPALAGEVFTLSEMTIEAHHHSTGTVLGFNGTTEWALDSVSEDEALWLPREDQLRELLGTTFVSLTSEPGADPWAVTVRGPEGSTVRHRASSASDAYGAALLALVRRSAATV